jgi:hypothetical protein
MMAKIMKLLPESNITFRQVQRLRRNYDELCRHGPAIVSQYDADPTPENMQAVIDQAKAVQTAYRLWDIAHRECYGF